jgi:hypothetical protein
MDNHQQLLKQRAALLPTGVPNSLDEALCSIRFSRQTRQVPQRRGHEDQTPMCLNGFGTPHAILVEAQMCVTVRIERFHPPLQIDGDNLTRGYCASQSPSRINFIELVRRKPSLEHVPPRFLDFSGMPDTILGGFLPLTNLGSGASLATIHLCRCPLFLSFIRLQV